MDLIALFVEYGGWSWVIAGIVLLAIELIAPGGVFLWLGGAAIVTGLISLMGFTSVAFQAGIFGALGLASIFFWLRYARKRGVPESDSPLLNQRAARLVGTMPILSEPIENGYGRVQIADSHWRVSGPDLPNGAKVRVVGFKGAVLEVEAA
jgi:membrane protein implicated in regulation of membrane protease activity